MQFSIRGPNFKSFSRFENVTVLFLLRLTADASTKVDSGKRLSYEVKCSMCDAIFIGSTQQIFKKRTDSHFSDHLNLLKNGQKYD